MVLKQSYSTDPNLNKMNEIESVKRVVEMVMGIDIFTKNRKRYVVESRMVFSTILRDMGYSLKEIGRILKKDHTTIIHYERKLKALLDVDKSLLKKYLKCRELLTLKEQPVNLLSQTDLVGEVYRLNNLVEILEKEKEILADEKKELINQFKVDDGKRLIKIFKLIEQNTPKGYELIVERKIRKMFDD
jgi:DNA-binding transcriptional MerR regulator